MDKQQLEAGLRALTFVKQFFPDAVIAGGFLRDLMNGRTPKDVDIFVGRNSDYDQLRAFEKLDNVRLLLNGEYMENPEVSMVWNVSGFEFPVQVIELLPHLTPISRISLFDFDFCQVGHDGLHWHFGDLWRNDPLSTTLVHCEDVKEMERSLRRWDRLKEKYPERQLHIPKKYYDLVNAAQVPV